MTGLEKIARKILVPLEKERHWRDHSVTYAAVTAKYQPHQGRKECERRLKQQQRTTI